MVCSLAADYQKLGVNPRDDLNDVLGRIAEHPIIGWKNCYYIGGKK